jgi:hypothetical protein
MSSEGTPSEAGPITVLTPDGPIAVKISDPQIRSLAARHLNAVRRYLEYGDPSDLAQFEDVVLVTRDGQRIRLATDLDDIDRLAAGNEVQLELYQR